jgi:hypothetical protein
VPLDYYMELLTYLTRKDSPSDGETPFGHTLNVPTYFGSERDGVTQPLRVKHTKIRVHTVLSLTGDQVSLLQHDTRKVSSGAFKRVHVIKWSFAVFRRIQVSGDYIYTRQL